MAIKIISNIFYRMEITWLSPKTFRKIRLIVFLNHTSLYEPLFLGALPPSFLWRLARKMVAPGADITLDRPLVGFFWRILNPGMMSISRKRDKSWTRFKQAIHDRSVIIIAAEGRMKRANGLDKNGHKMTVRSGVTELIKELDQEGEIMFVYSQGLHHIQIPGQKIPKLFKTVAAKIETVDIDQYKTSFEGEGVQWQRNVLNDIQAKLEKHCPQ